MNSAQFKLLKLRDRDMRSALDIINWQSDYLKIKQIDQYRLPYPDSKELKTRQDKGYNFSLYDISNKEIAVFVSLIPNYIPDGWKEFEPEKNYCWLTSLFTSKDYKGRNLGYTMLQEIDKKLISESFRIIMLDCHVGFGDFLVDFYRNDRYVEIARKHMIYPTNSFNAALMKKNLLTTRNK